MPEWRVWDGDPPTGEAVHVYRARLDEGLPPFEALLPRLSEDEQARALRFRFERDRRRFTVARYLLRRLLARSLGCRPEELTFAYGPHGKPQLTEASGWHFNLSHSQDWALMALTRLGTLGVDLECVRPLSEMQGMAERVLSPSELAAWKALPEAERPLAFFRAWTRKEAVLKALGEGLTFPLERLSVSLGEDARVLGFEGRESEVWQLVDLAPAPGVCGAIAHAAGPLEVRCLHWRPELPS